MNSQEQPKFTHHWSADGKNRGSLLMLPDQEHSFFHSGYRQILLAFEVPSSISGCQPWHRPNSSNNNWIISSPQDGQNKEYTVFAMLHDIIQVLTEAHVAPAAVTMFSQFCGHYIVELKRYICAYIFIYIFFLETHDHPGKAQKIQASSCIIHNNLKWVKAPLIVLWRN